MVTKLETLQSAGAAGPCVVSADVATIEIFDDLADARDAWMELFAIAPVSPYQSYPFLSAWFDTVGRENRLEPFIAVARDAAGRPRALLPFVTDTRGPLRIAAFLGGRESNFNLALVHPNARLDEKSMRALLFQAARRAPQAPDLFFLRNQPRRLDGAENPLAFADAGPSPSFAFGAALPAQEAELVARLSKDTRKKLRKKEARLGQMGELRYEHRATGELAQKIVSALIEQKSARFADLGVGGVFDSAGMCALLRRLADEGVMELHGLSVGGRIVATYAGLLHRARFSAILNSFDMDEEIARSSPGDLLLHALMRDLVSRGLTHFDLGAGEARYKNTVCDETIELCDWVAPVSMKGVLAAPLLQAYLHVKRRAKQTPAIARAYAAARRMIVGRR